MRVGNHAVTFLLHLTYTQVSQQVACGNAAVVINSNISQSCLWADSANCFRAQVHLF